MNFEDTPRLSDALFMAADDMESLVPNKNVKFSMATWLRGHRGTNDRIDICTVCLAGAIMLNRYDGRRILAERLNDLPTKTDPEIGPSFVAKNMGQLSTSPLAGKLCALDLARVGDYAGAIGMGWPESRRELSDETLEKLKRISVSKLSVRKRVPREHVVDAISQFRETIIPELRALGL